MSFSLDASVIMPLALSLLLNSSSLCLPEAVAARSSAAIAAQAVAREINPPHLYNLALLTDKERALPVLKCSPQKMVEAISLFRDGKSILTEQGNQP